MAAKAEVVSRVPDPSDFNSVTPELLAAFKYEALNDYVLVLPIKVPKSSIIEESDYWKQDPNWAVVMAVGEGRIVNGQLFPIKAQPGDIVYVTKYGEPVELDRVDFRLIHAAEIKLRRPKDA